MNRQSRRLENRDLAKLLAKSKALVAVVLNAKTNRFETIGSVVEGETNRPEELMARDLLNRLVTSKNLMNAELDRFAACEMRAKERSRTTGRPVEDCLRE